MPNYQVALVNAQSVPILLSDKVLSEPGNTSNKRREYKRAQSEGQVKVIEKTNSNTMFQSKNNKVNALGVGPIQLYNNAN